MENFKVAIEKFQSQEREKIKQEFKDVLDTLTQKVENLTQENTKLKRMCHRQSLHTKCVSEAANILTDLLHSDSLLNIVEEE